MEEINHSPIISLVCSISLTSLDAIKATLNVNPLSVDIKSESFPFCNHQSETLQLHGSKICWQSSQILIIFIDPLHPTLITSLAPFLRKPTNWILTKEVLFPDFLERCAEFLDAESINDGIDGRVAVGKDDGNEEEVLWIVTGRAEEGDAVEDVKRKPADCEEEKDKGKRLGQL